MTLAGLAKANELTAKLPAEEKEKLETYRKVMRQSFTDWVRRQEEYDRQEDEQRVREHQEYEVRKAAEDEGERQRRENIERRYGKIDVEAQAAKLRAELFKGPLPAGIKRAEQE